MTVKELALKVLDNAKSVPTSVPLRDLPGTLTVQVGTTVQARIRACGEVCEVRRSETETCWGCQGTGCCGCIACSGGICSACLGTGQLAWPESVQ